MGLRTLRDRKVASLAEVPLLAGLSQRELKWLSSVMDEVEIPEGFTLMRQGAVGREVFVVAEGSAQVTVDGSEVATVGPGAIIGEMSLLDQRPRSATVFSLTPMRLFVLEPRGFASALEELPEIGRGVLRSLSGRLRRAESAPE